MLKRRLLRIAGQPQHGRSIIRLPPTLEAWRAVDVEEGTTALVAWSGISSPTLGSGRTSQWCTPPMVVVAKGMAEEEGVIIPGYKFLLLSGVTLYAGVLLWLPRLLRQQR